MAPGLVGPEKAERGKLPTDVWWHTIVGTNAHERTGYPTQKPEALAERSCAPPAIPATWCSTRSPAAARSAPSPSASGAATC